MALAGGRGGRGGGRGGRFRIASFFSDPEVLSRVAGDTAAVVFGCAMYAPPCNRLLCCSKEILESLVLCVVLSYSRVSGRNSVEKKEVPPQHWSVVLLDVHIIYAVSEGECCNNGVSRGERRPLHCSPCTTAHA